MTSVVDVVRTYMDAASGLTRLTRQRAVVAAKTLLKVEDRFAGETPARDGSEEATRGSVGAGIQSLASELVATSAANREALSELVHSEMDRVLHEAGYVRREDHDRLLRRVVDLERRLAAFNSAPTVRAGAAALPPREDAAVVHPDTPTPDWTAQAAPSDPSDQGVPAPRDPAHATVSSAAARSGATTAQSASTTPADAEPGSPTDPRVVESKAPEPDTAETVRADSADSVMEAPEESATGSEPDAEPAGASTRATRTGGKSTTKTTGRSRSTKSTTKKSSTGKSGKSK